MKYFLVVALLAFPFVLSGVTHEVTMVGMTFAPETLSIDQNDSVLWINTSALFHTTTSGVSGVPSGYWDSGLMPPNDSFYFHFDSAGAFPYYCTPHWTLGMVGLITVAPLGIQEYSTPASVSLEAGQAYPNPTNGAARVDYALNDPGYVNIEIYNAAGQKIRGLVDADMPRGNYVAFWDGHDAEGNRAAPGAYFIRMQFGDEFEGRKVLLLR